MLHLDPISLFYFHHRIAPSFDLSICFFSFASSLAPFCITKCFVAVRCCLIYGTKDYYPINKVLPHKTQQTSFFSFALLLLGSIPSTDYRHKFYTHRLLRLSNNYPSLCFTFSPSSPFYSRFILLNYTHFSYSVSL